MGGMQKNNNEITQKCIFGQISSKMFTYPQEKNLVQR